MAKFIDLTGQKFGRLTVIKRDYTQREKGHNTYWICQCDCGKITSVNASKLKGGNTRSCGCLREEGRKNLNYKHGKLHTRLYKIWAMMKQRCNNKNAENYEYYGGKGIAICDEWLNSFEKFYEWAIENGYEENLTIDRINVNGNYEPANCKWSTKKQQARNRKSTVFVNIDGETKCMSEWAKECNIPLATFKVKLKRDKEKLINEVREILRNNRK